MADENVPLGGTLNDSTQNPDGKSGETGSNEPINDGGGEKKQPLQPWLGQCKGDLKYNETLAQYADPTSAAEALLDFHNNAVRVPGEDASEEQKAEYRKALNKYSGVPESKDEYEFSPPQIEGYAYDPNVAESLKDAAHEMNLSKDGFKAFNDWWNRMVKSSIDNFKKTRSDSVKKQKNLIKKDLGPDFEKTQERGILAIGGTNLLKYMKEHPEVRYSPEIVSAFVQMGSVVTEDQLPKGDNVSPDVAKGLTYPSMEDM